jgi:hypothetical protein
VDEATLAGRTSAKFLDGLAILKRLAAAGRLLDVGTGPGLFVRLAREWLRRRRLRHSSAD